MIIFLNRKGFWVYWARCVRATRQLIHCVLLLVICWLHRQRHANLHSKSSYPNGFIHNSRSPPAHTNGGKGLDKAQALELDRLTSPTKVSSMLAWHKLFCTLCYQYECHLRGQLKYECCLRGQLKYECHPRGQLKYECHLRGQLKYECHLYKGPTKIWMSPKGPTKIWMSPKGPTKIWMSPEGPTKIWMSPKGPTKIWM